MIGGSFEVHAANIKVPHSKDALPVGLCKQQQEQNLINNRFRKKVGGRLMQRTKRIS